MTSQEMTQPIRVRIYWLAAAIAILLAVSALFAADYPTSLLALLLGALLFANGWISQQHALPEDGQGPHILAHLVVGFLTVATLVSFIFVPDLAEYWCYLFPLIVFLVYRVKIASTLTAAYAVLVMFSLIQFYDKPAKVQIFFTFLLCLALTLAFVYLREIKERQLKPLRRTDSLTLASNREYLTQDLDKEVQRSEREGTDLSVLALALDPDCLTDLPENQLDLLLNRLGRTLHENLRLFDSYYRYNQTEFVVILPHTNTRGAMKTAEKLRLRCKQQLSSEDRPVTISLGIVGLNVGDDSESLIGQAHQALSLAQSRGHNQTCSHVELEQAEDEAHD